MHGKGILTLENDYVYKGEFKYGLRHGQGVLKSVVSDYFYNGNWKNGIKNGFGKENYPDGAYFEGNFLNGRKNGIGKMFLANGNIYEGEFNEDRISGYGKYVWDETKSYVGYFNNLCLDGFGVFTKDNEIYKGFFSMNKKHGLGIKIYTNKNMVLIGHWLNDAIDGLAVFISKHSNEEKFLYFEKDKTKVEIIDEIEIKKIKESQIYKEMIEFYSNLKE